MKPTLIASGLLLGSVVVGAPFLGEKQSPPTAKPVGETYFAEVAEDGTVLRVIVADQAFIDSGAVGDPKKWVQTYKDGKRANYAGVGFTYRKHLDRFEQPDPKDGSVYEPATGRYKPMPKLNRGTTTPL